MFCGNLVVCGHLVWADQYNNICGFLPTGLCSCKSVQAMAGNSTLSTASSNSVCFVLNHSGCELGSAVCYMLV